ncbi:MAG TPA: hypothetical protein VFY83_14455, partial [Anaerolineales bacterium]|nr:hypothetical protein [Anaerolineales bacterium]
MPRVAHGDFCKLGTPLVEIWFLAGRDASRIPLYGFHCTMGTILYTAPLFPMTSIPGAFVSKYNSPLSS